MRVLLVCVGRLKDGPDRQLYERYAQRFDAAGRALGLGPLTLHELPEGRASEKRARLADEGQRLIKLAGDAQVRVVLDERGKTLSSQAFSDFLARQRDGGAGQIAFLIGGPDGHDPTVLDRATQRLSLGPMTLPHGLARIILVEQLYRSATILSGHPYHRA